MSDLDLSFRALSVLHTSRFLFNKYGFHNVGVDRIIASANVTKTTFYKYFHSKARLIEMSLTFQKDALKEKVFSLIHLSHDLSVEEKLKKIYFLHVDIESFYHLPFKAIFELEKTYPEAYQVVTDYRHWLIKEIHQLILTQKGKATVEDAYLFLFVIDGAMVRLLGENKVDERDKLLDYFLFMVFEV
ncbi:TetR/AcrR family transcriptional regulator [Acinetobacter baumannii]